VTLPAQDHQAFDGDGGMVNAKLQERLATTLATFMQLVEAARNYAGLKERWIEFLGERADRATEREQTTTLAGA